MVCTYIHTGGSIKNIAAWYRVVKLKNAAWYRVAL
jgi:hypothetical protein